MTGSKADIPKELIAQIRYLEDLFTVDTTKLKEITDHFISELDKGTPYFSTSFSSRPTDFYEQVSA